MQAVHLRPDNQMAPPPGLNTDVGMVKGGDGNHCVAGRCGYWITAPQPCRRQQEQLRNREAEPVLSQRRCRMQMPFFMVKAVYHPECRYRVRQAMDPVLHQVIDGKHQSDAPSLDPRRASFGNKD